MPLFCRQPQLFMVNFAAGMFSAHAKEFIAQKKLPENYPQLQDVSNTAF
jgi:hypothetical protein